LPVLLVVHVMLIRGLPSRVVFTLYA